MVGSAKPGDQAAERGLARPGLADDGNLLPGGDLRVDVDQHRRLVLVAVATAVGERDVLDADAEQSRRQRDRVRRLGRADRDLEHAEHPAQAGDGGLGLVEDLGELGDRLEEPVRQEDEADQRARRSGRAPGPRMHADADHRGDGERR